MQRKWFKFIAGLEIIGGLYGLTLIVRQLVTLPINVYVIFLGIIVVAIYITSFVAGVLLWRGSDFGQNASVIIQAIQVPKIISNPFTYAFSFGADVYVHYTRNDIVTEVGLQSNFGAFHSLFINNYGGSFGLGLSLTACIFLFILIRNKWREPISESN